MAAISNPLKPEDLASLYLSLKEKVIDAGFDHEIDWQDELVFDEVTETTFLREAAWVILSSGFRESILRRKFGDVCAAFLGWVSASAISAQLDSCRRNALHVFNNQRKIEAIVTTVLRVSSEGIEEIKSQIKEQGVKFIQGFPFMGPVTSLHLAKNLGFAVVKPDRHLMRISEIMGYKSPESLCRTISEIVGDSLAVVDLVIWRYAVLSKNYENIF